MSEVVKARRVSWPKDVGQLWAFSLENCVVFVNHYFNFTQFVSNLFLPRQQYIRF